MLVRGLDPGQCASWVQAWGSIGAIAATAFAVWISHRLEQARSRAAEEKARNNADATLLLSLQALASELRRMNVLVGYQIDAPGNKIIYADVAGEFRAVAAMLTQLPVDQIAKVGKLSDFLELRRTATELAMIYDASPSQGDGFYRRNRGRLHELHAACSACSARLSAEIKRLDPKLFAANEAEIEKL